MEVSALAQGQHQSMIDVLSLKERATRGPRNIFKSQSGLKLSFMCSRLNVRLQMMSKESQKMRYYACKQLFQMKINFQYHALKLRYSKLSKPTIFEQPQCRI